MAAIAEKRPNYSSDAVLSSVELDISFLDSYYWREWDKTGFRLRQQIRKLIFDYQAKISQGESPQDAVIEWTQETTEDIEGFWFEYLCQRLVLPIKIKKQTINNQPEIVAPFYGDLPLAKTAIPEERNGAVKEAMEKTSEFLIKASRGSAAILISPAGWSGLKNDLGEKIVYTETQIYVYQVNVFDQIEAITLRVDNSLPQNTALYTALSGGRPSSLAYLTSDRLVIEEMVRNPILIDGAETPTEIREIIRTVETIKGSKYCLKERTFAELREQYQNRLNFSLAAETADLIIQGFSSFAASYEQLSDEAVKEIAQELENTLRRLFRTKRKPETDLLLTDPVFLSVFERQKELAEIQRLSGCTGTALSGPLILITPLGARSYRTESGTKYAHCGKCGKTNSFKESEAICQYAIKIS